MEFCKLKEIAFLLLRNTFVVLTNPFVVATTTFLTTTKKCRIYETFHSRNKYSLYTLDKALYFQCKIESTQSIRFPTP